LPVKHKLIREHTTRGVIKKEKGIQTVRLGRLVPTGPERGGPRPSIKWESVTVAWISCRRREVKVGPERGKEKHKGGKERAGREEP